MASKSKRKDAGVYMICAALMAFSVILHPKEQQIETARDETRRKKDPLSGEPLIKGQQQDRA